MIFRFGFHRRAKFGKFLTEQNLVGNAVEVGVNRGRFAEVLLNNWKGTYTGVDHYPSLYDPVDPSSQGDRQKDYEAGLLAISNFGNRASILKLSSVEGAKNFRNDFLDFVYLDAKHRYKDIMEDLEAWWSKVKKGGVFAGHDVICPSMEANEKGGWALEVQPALHDFFGSKAEAFLVTEDDGEPWSYFIFKN